jgi:DNA modification methylase
MEMRMGTGLGMGTVQSFISAMAHTPVTSMTQHRIIIGDSRSMGEVPDSSVHLVITSPPYWQLKDYGAKDQLGFHDSYEDYINNLNVVWSECVRVLHPGCRLCINIGDQFARSVYYGRYKVIPIRTEIIKFCESAGLDYMGAVIWRKVTTCNTTGGATIMGSFPYPRNGILKLDYEFILLFKKHGKAPKVEGPAKERARMSTDEWNEFFSGHWSFPGEKQKGHLAMFPEELPRRLIRMFSFEGETVLDPFLGSGTTSLAAINLGRDSIGYEINDDFIPVIREKLGPRKKGVALEFSKQKGKATDIAGRIAKLPYVFSDPLSLDKRTDPRLEAYGSKVSGREKKGRALYSVKGVVSPVMLLLSDGSRVRMLGVSELPSRKNEALEFLRDCTKGRKVFLRTDGDRTDSAGNRMCYIYLKNRTFLNARMLKKGLALPDDSVEHRLQVRFGKMADLAGRSERGV